MWLGDGDGQDSPPPIARACSLDIPAAGRHMPVMEFPAKPWPTGTAEQLEPLVRRVLAANPSAFTYTGTQSYVVGAGQEVAVIDPGPDEPAHLGALLDVIGSARLTAILCTHTHRDHSPAAAPLAQLTGAPVIGCAPLALVDGGPRSDAPFDQTYAPGRVLEDGESLTGPGWTLTALATPGHTSNHLCFALEESGALFTGDHVMGWSTSVIAPPDGDMSAYMASLQKLYDRTDRVYYPAHGPQVDKPQQLVRGMMGHRRQRERQIVRLLGEGLATIEEMVPRMYQGVDRALWPAAGRSVLAHLLDLERRGAAAAEDDRWKLVA